MNLQAEIMDSQLIPFRHIHILGACGAGTTTLGTALAAELGYRRFDSDDFFWKDKYTVPRPREDRVDMLRKELDTEECWILSGALIDWGNPLAGLFDLVVFLSIPDDKRMDRLMEREYLRYGDSILPGNSRHGEYMDFIGYASKYETGGLEIRSRFQQEEWMKKLSCQVLRIEGDYALSEKIGMVLEFRG